MTLLDRFRAQSRDKHSDPAVRLAFVEELPLSEKEAIAAAAREDDDPRVQEGGGHEADGARRPRGDRPRRQPTRACARRPRRCCATSRSRRSRKSAKPRASRRSTRSRTRGRSARSRRSATREVVAARVRWRASATSHALGSVARHAARRADPDARARGRCASRVRTTRSLAVAMNSDFKDTALGALELITDRAELRADRGQRPQQERRRSARVRSCARPTSRRLARRPKPPQRRRSRQPPRRRTRRIARKPKSPTPPHGDPLGAHAAAEVTP